MEGVSSSSGATRGIFGQIQTTPDGQQVFVPVSLNQPPDQYGQQQKPYRDFSYLRAAGRFMQGAVYDTARGIFSTSGLVALGVSAAATAVFGGPALIGLGLLGAVLGTTTIFNGLTKSRKHYAEGDVEKSENAYREIGVGTAATALSVGGLWGSAKGYLLNGKGKLAEIGLKAQEAAQSFFGAMGKGLKAFVGEDGRTLQIPQFAYQRFFYGQGQGPMKIGKIPDWMSNPIVTGAFSQGKEATARLLSNGTVANGLAYNTLYREGTAHELKDKLDCI